MKIIIGTIHTQHFVHICPKHPCDLLELKYILCVFIYSDMITGVCTEGNRLQIFCRHKA